MRGETAGQSAFRGSASQVTGRGVTEPGLQTDGPAPVAAGSPYQRRLAGLRSLILPNKYAMMLPVMCGCKGR